jgi:hypothetical protein
LNPITLPGKTRRAPNAPNSITRLPNYSITNLFHFFMRRMLPATLAELLKFQTPRRGLLVLGRRIVPLFAVAAL